MTLDEKDRQNLIKYRKEKAAKAFEDAYFCIENEKLHMAVNRIYYGGFYILSALALKHQFANSKHQSLIGWFNKNFVKENRVEKKHGRFIHKAYDRRSKADYADYVKFDKEEIMAMHSEMRDFLRRIEELLEESECGTGQSAI